MTAYSHTADRMAKAVAAETRAFSRAERQHVRRIERANAQIAGEQSRIECEARRQAENRRFEELGAIIDASIARTRAWIAEDRQPDDWPRQWAEAEARLSGIPTSKIMRGL